MHSFRWSVPFSYCGENDLVVYNCIPIINIVSVVSILPMGVHWRTKTKCFSTKLAYLQYWNDKKRIIILCVSKHQYREWNLICSNKLFGHSRRHPSLRYEYSYAPVCRKCKSLETVYRSYELPIIQTIISKTCKNTNLKFSTVTKSLTTNNTLESFYKEKCRKTTVQSKFC